MATLRTLPEVADPGGLATGIELASARGHGAAATTWRLHLQQLEPGTHAAFHADVPVQLTPLDAPLSLGQAPDRPLLRLQVTRPGTAQILHLAEATRIAWLEHGPGDDVELIARPLQGPMLLPTVGQGWLAWLLVGRATVRLGTAGWELAPNAPAWLPSDEEQRLRLEGGGEVLLVRFRTLPAA